MPKITPFLWFDDQAEQAANFYVSVFMSSRITNISRRGEAGPGPPGSVMAVEFELDGQRFIALNGGPHFRFTEAIPFSVECRTQQEVDEFWEKLSEELDMHPAADDRRRALQTRKREVVRRIEDPVHLDELRSAYSTSVMLSSGPSSPSRPPR